MRAVPLLVLLLSLAPGCGASRPSYAPAATAAGTFEAVRAATLARDWKALYLLNAPTERREAEARWDAARRDPARREAVERMAEETGRTPDEVARMTLEELFVARTAQQHRDQGETALKRLRAVKVRDTVDQGDGRVALLLEIEGAPMEMPYREERGLWYVADVLEGWTQF